jgi:hypothetical protein
MSEPETDPAVAKELAEAMERARAEVAAMKAKARKVLEDRQQEAAKVVPLKPKAKTFEETVKEVRAEFKEAPKAVLMPKIEALVEPAFFDEKDLTRVPGVVGRVIDWIEAASLCPNRPLALGAGRRHADGPASGRPDTRLNSPLRGRDQPERDRQAAGH